MNNRFKDQRYKIHVPPNLRVLHIGCGDGTLLHALQPSTGYGVTLDAAKLAKARQMYPRNQFFCAMCEIGAIDPVDVIIIDPCVIGACEDIQCLLHDLHRFCHERTRILIGWYVWGWRPILCVAQWFQRKDSWYRNWLYSSDLLNLTQLAGYDVVTIEKGLLFPWNIPLISWLLNNVIGSLPLVRALGLFRCAVVRPCVVNERPSKLSVSVIIPCRNERGNIERAVQEVPDMGAWTELIFVEGHSHDGTLEELYRVKAAYPHKWITILVQHGKGKRDAVEMGFMMAHGDIFMILDADLTMPPEALAKFYDVLVQGHGEFVNGSRLVYRMESRAMPWLNFWANHGFSLLFSWLIGQRLTDTLCGTKVLLKKDYERIKRERNFFGTLDPFGDFDLLFGAARWQLKIVNVPIRYKNRTYGVTQIRRFYHGWLLLRMCAYAAWKLKLRW